MEASEHDAVTEQSSTWRVYRPHMWMSLCVIAVVMVECMIPIRLGVAYNSRSHGLDELVDFYRVFVVPWLILPWCLFIAWGAEGAPRVLALTCYSKALFVGVAIIYMKLTMFPQGPNDRYTEMESFLDGLCVLLVTISFYVLYPIGALLSLPAVPNLLFGITTAKTLAAKGYEFGMRDRAMLFLRLGWKRFKRLPRREELAVVPGYGMGRVDNVVHLMKNP